MCFANWASHSLAGSQILSRSYPLVFTEAGVLTDEMIFTEDSLLLLVVVREESVQRLVSPTLPSQFPPAAQILLTGIDVLGPPLGHQQAHHCLPPPQLSLLSPV